MSKILPVTFQEFKILLHYAQTHHSGLNEPIPQMGVEQSEKIRSCLDHPFLQFGGKFLYSGFYKKAAILFYIMNKNHPLINGNKRMACLTLGLFCAKNRRALRFSWEAFYENSKRVTESDPSQMDIIIKGLESTFKRFIPISK